MQTFKSILQFQKHFDTDEKCRQHLELSRWNATPACPFCGSTGVHRFPNGMIFKCRDCRKKFSVTVGTMYENTKIPLTKWFLATYILTNHSRPGWCFHQHAIQAAPQLLVTLCYNTINGKKMNIEKNRWEQ